MKMTIVDQVNVDTGSLVGARTSNKFVAQSSTHHHHLGVQDLFKRLYIVKLAGRSKGTPANRLIATARSFGLYSLSFSDSYSDFPVLFGALTLIPSYSWTSGIGSNCSILLWYIS